MQETCTMRHLRNETLTQRDIWVKWTFAWNGNCLLTQMIQCASICSRKFLETIKTLPLNPALTRRNFIRAYLKILKRRLSIENYSFVESLPKLFGVPGRQHYFYLYSFFGKILPWGDSFSNAIIFGSGIDRHRRIILYCSRKKNNPDKMGLIQTCFNPFLYSNDPKIISFLFRNCLNFCLVELSTWRSVSSYWNYNYSDEITCQKMSIK